MELRQGRKVGRTLYTQFGPDPSDDDQLVGLVDTEELAAAICEAFNGGRNQAMRHELWCAYRDGQLATVRDGVIGANPYGVDW